MSYWIFNPDYQNGAMLWNGRAWQFTPVFTAIRVAA
jgi:hypothetical protein